MKDTRKHTTITIDRGDPFLDDDALEMIPVETPILDDDGAQQPTKPCRPDGTPTPTE